MKQIAILSCFIFSLALMPALADAQDQFWQDADNDGLSDQSENLDYKTDPNLIDTDGGGVADGLEILLNNSDPLDNTDDFTDDKDKDGLPDADETALGTDPNNSDTDGDGYSDGAEFLAGYSPLVAGGELDGRNPASAGIIKSSLYGIEKIATVNNQIELSGYAPALTDLRIFVLLDSVGDNAMRSSTKSLSDGTWNIITSVSGYGSYEVYVVPFTGDNILAKSSPKIVPVSPAKTTEDNALYSDPLEAPLNDDVLSTSFFDKYLSYWPIVLAVLLGVVAIVGTLFLVNHLRRKKDVKLIKKIGEPSQD